MSDDKLELPRLYLASSSPRRRQLLESMGLEYIPLSPECTESKPSPDELTAVTIQNAAAKAQAVISEVRAVRDVVIAADTLVTVDRMVLGKPQDRDDAVRILRALSGRKHSVVTGLVLSSEAFGTLSGTETSSVYFRDLDDADIENYLTTKEPWDKAGAYAVQGLGALFIERIEGSYTNVMGLPVSKLLTELARLTGIDAFRWFR